MRLGLRAHAARTEESEDPMTTIQRPGPGDGTAAKRSGGVDLLGLAIFSVFAILWVAFGAALILSQGSLDQAWEWIRSLPTVLQVVVWFLFLPVVAGLWIWETSWPLIVRAILVGGLGIANVVAFIPRGLFGWRT